MSKLALAANILTCSPRWHLINAKRVPVGRVAQKAAHLILGKHKPIYHPALDIGDCVVVINSNLVGFCGKKWKEKKYYKHSGYPGGLQVWTAEQLHEKKPTELIRKAVWGMLPSNALRYKMMKRLFIFIDDKHPFEQNIDSKVHLEQKANATYSPKIVKAKLANLSWDDINEDGSIF
ncbi:large ribosomal subunit protein uL13-like [Zophobas morio]|uniref:large ribosomal subunit protein uL13-like n=1 Tax=Zophobas morio TaxID=2755281 RepID=UPI0030836B43